MAIVRSIGGWLGPGVRKVAPPPRALFEAFLNLPRSPEFIELPIPAARTERVVVPR